MRIHVKYCLVCFAILASTAPVWARIYKSSLNISDNTTIGSAQLKPGSYELTADDSKKELNIIQKGKIIATVQGQWVKMPEKARDSGVDSVDNKITEVRFGGSDEAFQLP